MTTMKEEKGFAAVFFLIGVILVISLVVMAFFLGRLSSQIGSSVGRGIPRPLNFTPTLTPTPSVTGQASSSTPSPSVTEVKTLNWDLYKLQMELTSGWSGQETNRRPEPTGGASSSGHDCADYRVSSSDGFASLTFKPICGVSDTSFQPLPENTVVVKNLGDNRSIIRFFDPATGGYKYSLSGLATITDDSSQHQAVMQTGSLAIPYNQSDGLVILRAEYKYAGFDSSRDQYLQNADKIITSLKKF